jgi:3-hydroxyisobutyrate dehydrogenase-like beta-hydroxyacid dehydrogenase
MASLPIRRIAIIGFGEVGGIFGNDLAKQGIETAVFDILLASKRHRQQMLAKARTCGVKATSDLSDCLPGADLVISAVTASSAVEVAKKAGKILCSGQIFLDINSVSPGTKRSAAGYVTKSNAHFVEAAVMAPVVPQRLKIPMLLGGPYAAEMSERLKSIGMQATALSEQIGFASAVKMCRSVMIKGLEALAVECLLAARRYGAEDTVLKSLAATYPGLGWQDHQPDYLIGRVAEHGRRRAAEMREAAAALKEVGIEPAMALATARCQESVVTEMATSKLRFEDMEPFCWSWLADELARNATTGLRGKKPLALSTVRADETSPRAKRVTPRRSSRRSALTKGS